MAIDDTAYKFGAWALARKLGMHVTNTLPTTRPAQDRPADPHRATDNNMPAESTEPFPVDAYGHPRIEKAPTTPTQEKAAGAVSPSAQKMPKIEPMKLDKPPKPADSMDFGQPQAAQPSQWDLDVKAPTKNQLAKLSSVKLALSPATLMSYAGKRQAQGLGAARGLGERLKAAPGATSREMMQASPAARHQMGEAADAARVQQRAQQFGQNPRTQAMQARAQGAAQETGAAARDPKAAPIRNQAYEGYDYAGMQPYSQAHERKFLGAPQQTAGGAVKPEGGQFAGRVDDLGKWTTGKPTTLGAAAQSKRLNPTTPAPARGKSFGEATDVPSSPILPGYSRAPVPGATNPGVLSPRLQRRMQRSRKPNPYGATELATMA